MVLLNEAIEWVCNEIESNVDKGVLGTGTTIASATDTGVETPDTNTITDLTNTISGNQITFKFIKTSTTGVGTTYSEYGIYDNINNIDWTRYLFTPLEASGSEDWTISLRLFVRSV